jgi:SAM-dependent methyltransferase
MSRRTANIGRHYFEELYTRDPDPWRFGSSPYEREKYAASLSALPRQTYECGLEVGCSIGIFTRMLAQRCGSLLAIDVAEAALAQARINCPMPNVIFENRTIPSEWPPGRFDLIVLSEVLYYLDGATVARVARQACDSLSQSGGTILLVHYLGETDYPLTGDQAAGIFMHTAGMLPTHVARTRDYRIDVLESGAFAQGPAAPDGE